MPRPWFIYTSQPWWPTSIEENAQWLTLILSINTPFVEISGQLWMDKIYWMHQPDISVCASKSILLHQIPCYQVLLTLGYVKQWHLSWIFTSKGVRLINKSFISWTIDPNGVKLWSLVGFHISVQAAFLVLLWRKYRIWNLVGFYICKITFLNNFF